MRALIALLLAALLLLAAPAAAKPKACSKLAGSADSYVWGIRPKCMPGFTLTCTKACRSHLKKVGWRGASRADHFYRRGGVHAAPVP